MRKFEPRAFVVTCSLLDDTVLVSDIVTQKDQPIEKKYGEKRIRRGTWGKWAVTVNLISRAEKRECNTHNTGRHD